MPVDPEIKAVLDFIASRGYPPMHEGTPEDARKAYRAMTVDTVSSPVPVGSVSSLSVAGLPARVYRPEGTGELPTLVYLHGGGFVIGDLDTHDQLCRRLCAGADVVVLSVDYRLAPEHPFPAAVDDALAAVDWAAAHLGELGGSSVLAVGGDSAGGNLAAVVAQARRDVVSSQVLIYPAVDAFGDYSSRVENAEGYFLEAATMEWFFGHYAGTAEVAADDVRHSPLLGDLSGVAPAVVVTAEFDPLRDEGEAYADALSESGVRVSRTRYDGMIHGFVDMVAYSPAAAAAVDDLVARTRVLLHD
ncbi:alpha/beta hydrolase [Nocardioides sp. LS1]|uniref:alpha/beta hydrolase n=1 Tax=Nocardioides sp. LS1 TaxID=1027620 RepID=UPI000F618CFB|nr:alpha/beta hydrolase [Nocardioides sp. LS1]GCD90688.1 esterase [Nocardioides sp. LS1]